MQIIEINVARDFYPKPFGRYHDDGKFNGTKFREEFLIPKLRESDELVVNFSECPYEIGSSFLEESFGGLVRALQDSPLLNKLTIRARSLAMDMEIKSYIDDAKKRLMVTH